MTTSSANAHDAHHSQDGLWFGRASSSFVRLADALATLPAASACLHRLLTPSRATIPPPSLLSQAQRSLDSRSNLNDGRAFLACPLSVPPQSARYECHPSFRPLAQHERASCSFITPAPVTSTSRAALFLWTHPIATEHTPPPCNPPEYPCGQTSLDSLVHPKPRCRPT